MENQTTSNQPAKPPQTESLEVPAGSAADNSSPPPAKPPRKISLGRLGNSKRLYAWVFLIVIILAAAVVYATIRWSRSPGTGQGPAQSLSAGQLSALAANTTNVGNSNQTLNVQSNAVFEGQVLLRENLEVAGSIKIGGSLSLPAISVGGSSSFGQLQVNNTLSVSGNTIIQGQLSLQKNLTVAGSASFGSLSASQINVTSLQLNGDLTISHHLVPSGGVPGRSNGTALGGGGTASVSGSDTAGTVTINTGGSPPAGCFVTVNFTQKFNTTPHVVISPSNSSAASLDYYTNRSSTSFSICTDSAPAASTAYLFDYVVLD